MKKQPNVIVLPASLAYLYERKWAFLGLFVLVFFISHTILALAGVAPGTAIARLPLPNAGDSATDSSGGFHLPEGEGELPLRIEIPSLGIRATVANPKTADVAALDQALLGGTVRYPGSGTPGEEGNVLIFGHSSHLPVVYNQAFKAFNDIQKLASGEPIVLYGEGKAFVYAVEKVEQASAATDAIPLGVDGALLTLATCNNFGTKEDRFIVTARLVKVEEKPAE